MQTLKKLLMAALLTLATILPTTSATAAEFDHSIWQDLLQKNVVLIKGGQASQVDYEAMLKARPQLQQYLAQLSAVSTSEFASWPKTEQLAFLLNAYNAFTVELVLTKYPKLKSIKDIGSIVQSPWKKRFVPLLGEMRSLDDIEQGMIRKVGDYNEPRIHFAANCASIGCPALRNEAYTGAQLDAQLEAATKAFLSDQTRNRYNTQTNKLEVSKIFDWYKKDFERGWHGWKSLNEFFAHYADSLTDSPEIKQALIANKVDVVFLDYNWNLNRKQ
ncbi:MAG: DUF547 domain-containing protein [Betaproteobacteria bacterium HGW-Betaproteobacteria-22]|nr:MAG: DUF547 domain-containing protein [Betaproteobacteria bacterium HGW-Betaproteobacteria-22]